MIGDKNPEGADSDSISSGIFYIIGPDGSWSAETELGSVNKDVDSLISAEFDYVNTITIGDVTMLLAYQIQEYGRSRVHRIRFRSDGHCYLYYIDTGKLLIFELTS